MRHAWGSRVSMVTLVLLFVGTSWAGGPNAGLSKSNSLTVENDPTTSGWIATCDISVSGVDPQQIYSGVVYFASVLGGGQTGGPVYSFTFQVDPANRTWAQISPGIYKVRAKLKGQDVTVHGEFKFGTLLAGDKISCHSRIDPGTQPPPTGTTLFGSDMDATVQTP
jgi:hypothetical protein